jgi:hypothetical protein
MFQLDIGFSDTLPYDEGHVGYGNLNHYCVANNLLYFLMHVGGIILFSFIFYISDKMNYEPKGGKLGFEEEDE